MELSVLSLNTMHGRNKRNAMWPLRVGRSEVERNLDKIAACIRAHNLDLVALQEVDEGSILSGNFNQFEFLRAKSGYAHGYFTPSCRVTLFGKNIFVSGQAILSKYPLSNCRAHRFPFTFPTDRMGFVVADAEFPSGKTITVASIHLVYLDWLRRNSRVWELELIQKAINDCGNPVVLAGDFNCDPTFFLNPLGFEALASLPTHPSWEPSACIDWIVAKGLRSVFYRSLPDKVSDHLAVVAQLEL